MQCGFVMLDEQAFVLGLSRSTAWTVTRGMHKTSGLSAMTINRMLASHRLPPKVRAKLLEYIAEKLAGDLWGPRISSEGFREQNFSCAHASEREP